MMTAKLGIYLTLLCFMGNIKDSWQQDQCPSDGTHFFGIEQQQVEYAGDESCLWRVQDDVLDNNYAIFLMIYNTTLVTPDNLCIGQLLLPGDNANKTCENLDHGCFVYYKETICNQDKISAKITEKKFDCNNILFHSANNSIRIQYNPINTSMNENFPAFQMFYKPINCDDNRDEATTPFGRNIKKDKDDSGKNDKEIPINSEKEPLSTEKTVITIVAATIGTITILLIVVTIIKREKAHRRNIHQVELNNTKRERTNTEREHELYSPNGTFKDSDGAQETENLNHASNTKEDSNHQV